MGAEGSDCDLGWAAGADVRGGDEWTGGDWPRSGDEWTGGDWPRSEWTCAEWTAGALAGDADADLAHVGGGAGAAFDRAHVGAEPIRAGPRSAISRGTRASTASGMSPHRTSNEMRIGSLATDDGDAPDDEDDAPDGDGAVLDEDNAPDDDAADNDDAPDDEDDAVDDEDDAADDDGDELDEGAPDDEDDAADGDALNEGAPDDNGDALDDDGAPDEDDAPDDDDGDAGDRFGHFADEGEPARVASGDDGALAAARTDAAAEAPDGEALKGLPAAAGLAARVAAGDALDATDVGTRDDGGPTCGHTCPAIPRSSRAVATTRLHRDCSTTPSGRGAASSSGPPNKRCTIARTPALEPVTSMATSSIRTTATAACGSIACAVAVNGLTASLVAACESSGVVVAIAGEIVRAPTLRTRIDSAGSRRSSLRMRDHADASTSDDDPLSQRASADSTAASSRDSRRSDDHG